MRNVKHFGQILGLLFTMVITSASAQDIGLDVLALQKRRFPVKDVVEMAPDNFVVGTLDWTFGTSLAPIRRVLDTGKVLRWRLHFFNGPGLRNNQLGTYEPHYGYHIASFAKAWEQRNEKLVGHLRKRVELYCALFAKYPGVTLEISPTLEHNLTARAFREQVKVVRRACPLAVIVDNPVGGVRTSGLKLKVERHGVKATVSAPCNASLDGDSVEDIDLLAYKRKFQHCTVLIWSRVLNCRLASGSFIDPRKRKACPTRDQMRAMFEYMKPLPEAPQVAECRAVVAPRLWKSFADYHGTFDIKANKPVWLSPARIEGLEVRALNRKLIGYLSYLGTFDGGGYRYYSGLGGNSTAMDLVDMAKSENGNENPFVTLHEGGQCFGPINPLLRYGFYR